MIQFKDKLLLVEGADLLLIAEHLLDLMQARQFSLKPVPDVNFMSPAAIHKIIGCSEEKIRKAIRAGKYGVIDSNQIRPRLYATVTDARAYHFGQTANTRKLPGGRKDPYQ